ncbi:hypothetical protein RhiirC2_796064 [Rhizophagus irregularis]|uniref:Uncharacterized protein n=1 Tax=Rhizophagus irregularis TaxID=588596 RepID=A0A2N1MAD2_9GLOM|nr:hypothetical protein RhiirC2_796064 [Rhizophagus irregularis]
MLKKSEEKMKDIQQLIPLAPPTNLTITISQEEIESNNNVVLLCKKAQGEEAVNHLRKGIARKGKTKRNRLEICSDNSPLDSFFSLLMDINKEMHY